MQQTRKFSAEDTYLLPAIRAKKPHIRLKNGFQTLLAFCGATIILFVYFVVPLAQLFNFLNDWIAQVLCAFCILILIEGAIGLILLNIAQSVELDYKKQLKSSDYTIEKLSTMRLPVTFKSEDIDELERNRTELSPGIADRSRWQDIELEETNIIPTIQ